MARRRSRHPFSFVMLIVGVAALGFVPIVLSMSVRPPAQDPPAPWQPQLRNPRSADEPRPETRSKEQLRPGRRVSNPVSDIGDAEAADARAIFTPQDEPNRQPGDVPAPGSQAGQPVITYFPGTLVGADDINRPELADRLRVLDVRPWEKYIQRHVSGAVHVDVHNWIKGFRAAHPVSEWEKRIGELGIDLETTVVVCDDGSGKDAASLWSILRYWGIKDVRVLNGGWSAWLFAGAYQDDTETIAAPRSIKLERNAAWVISRDELPKLLKTGDEQIVQALSPEESRGTRQTRSGERDLGRLKCLGWVEVIDWRNSTFISASDLQLLFRSAEIDPERPIVVYGDSLEQAAMLSFALEAVGAKQVSMSFRGWDQ